MQPTMAEKNAEATIVKMAPRTATGREREA